MLVNVINKKLKESLFSWYADTRLCGYKYRRQTELFLLLVDSSHAETVTTHK